MKLGKASWWTFLLKGVSSMRWIRGGLEPKTFRPARATALSMDPSASKILCLQRLARMFSEKGPSGGQTLGALACWPPFHAAGSPR